MKVEETLFYSYFDSDLLNWHSDDVDALSMSDIKYLYTISLEAFCLTFNIETIRFELTENRFLVFPFKNNRIYLTTNGIPKTPYVSIILYKNHPIYIIHEKDIKPSTILLYRNPKIAETDLGYLKES